MKRRLCAVAISAMCAMVGAAQWAVGADDKEAKKADDGFVAIFDGKTLKDWDGNPDFWSVQDGAITGQTTAEKPTKGNTFIVWRGGETGDFELKAEYKIIGGNSGIQYRSFEVPNEKWVIGGYQGDMEAGDTWSGSNYGERFRGILAARGDKTVIGKDHKSTTVGKVGDSAELQKNIKKEDWNEFEIIAQGNHLIHKINGKVTADVTDEDTDARATGVLALQLHAGAPMKVQFRNIRIKKLAPAAKTGADNSGGKKKIVFIAGMPSHGYGAHEHNAGCLLLGKELQRAMPSYDVVVYQNGWPKDANALDGADAVIMYCDGGGGHMVNAHLEEFDKLMKQGVGVACIHYAVEIPKGKAGDYFLDWLGGYFETNWSVNPHWTADFTKFPEHPITRGVKPFKINDEWYYHMRFRDKMQGVTPILTALPPKDTLSRADGTHSGNPDVRAAVERGEAQHMAWASERANGGRGFGFTGGHVHWNWGDDNFRRLVLNAIVWIAKGEVPAGGVSTTPQSQEDLEANQDEPKPEKKGAAIPRRPGIKAQFVADTKIVGDIRDSKNAVAGLDVAEGLEATLFAAEPMMLSPADIDVDHLGRVWVCEVQNYRGRNGTRKEGDRILVLEDTNGDGVADKSTVFYQGRDIDSALGICVLGNKVIVSCAPNVLVFTDEDGDLKPDKKEFLFTKVGLPQHDHSTHAFVFGPDGKLYWCVGNTGQSVSDKDGNPVVDTAGNKVIDNGKPYFGGMPFRCNLDGSEFEVLGHNFRNNYEVTVDSFGNVWQSDNDDDGNKGVRINYIMEYGNYGYRDEMTGAGWNQPYTNQPAETPLRHWHLTDPGVVPNLVQTGAGSPTGILFYEGNLLPEPFRNQVIHCDAGPNVTRAYPAKKDGAGFKAEMLNVLHGARDNWFRPSDVCTAPDGSLIIADWYDPGVGGHAMGDVDKGRLFRVAPPGKKYTIPKYDYSTAAGAVEALQNPNLSVRYMAWTALHAMGAKAEPELLKLEKSDNPRYRARALWLLGKTDGKGQQYVDLAIADKDEDIRIVGLRLARQLKLNLSPILQKLVRDPSPQVRREVAIALRHNELPEAPALWAELASQHDGKDRWYLEALGIGADRQWDKYFSAWLKKVGESWTSPAGRDIVWRSRSAQTPALLVKIISDPTTPAEELPHYLRAFDFLSGPEKDAALLALAFGDLKGNAEQKKIIGAETLKRMGTIDLAQHPEHAGALERVLEAQKGTGQYVMLIDKFNVAKRYPELAAIALSDADPQSAADAARVLLAKNQGQLLGDKLGDADPKVVAAAVAALGASADNKAVDLLWPLATDKDRDIAVRRDAVRALAKIRNGAVRLVNLAQKNNLDDSLKVAAALPLNTAPWDDIKKEAVKLFPLPAAKDNQQLPPLPQLLGMQGDVSRGKTVFENQGTCAKCHVVGTVGKEVGPNLSEIGGKLSREAFYESILYPSAGISHNYETTTVVLADGNIVTGIITSQTDKDVTLKLADALVKTIDKSDIEEMKKQTISLMPADLQKTITAQELADVVSYLMTLKKPAN